MDRVQVLPFELTVRTIAADYAAARDSQAAMETPRVIISNTDNSTTSGVHWFTVAYGISHR